METLEVSGPRQRLKSDREARRKARAIAGRYWQIAVVAIVLVGFLLTVPSVQNSSSTTLGSGTATTGRNVHGTISWPAPGTVGTTVTGSRCGPGVRQVQWSAYSPICEPVWHGDNGGATAPGVTATSINVTYREVSTGEQAAFNSIIPVSVIGTDTQAQAALETYIGYFNTQFELYGRKVVLKPFSPQSDFTVEFAGGDQAAAQSDAVTAEDEGAFADVSLLNATPVYEQALAEHKIISLSIYDSPLSEYQQYDPYTYSNVPVCNKSDAVAASIVRNSLAATPVSFAGDASLIGKKRVFGMIVLDNPQYHNCGTILQNELSQVGINLARVVEISIDPASMSQQIASAVTQLKAAGVTTVLANSLDFFTPILIGAEANRQGYHPEWMTTDILDGFSRLPPQDQWAHAISLGIQSPASSDTEAYRAFQKASPGSVLIPSYPYLYEQVLLLFDSLQQAGPDLTAQTFQQGFRTLPPSLPGGMYGDWSFGSQSYDPYGTTDIVWWDPHATSGLDHQPGAWQNCSDGKRYLFTSIVSEIPVGKPLDCFVASGTSGNSIKPVGK